jgi:hypothetical protein
MLEALQKVLTEVGSKVAKPILHNILETVLDLVADRDGECRDTTTAEFGDNGTSTRVTSRNFSITNA